MMEVNIKVTGVKEAQTKFEGLKSAVLKVAAMALNRAAKTGQVRMQQMSREEYTMKAADAKRELKIDKANMRFLQASVTASAKPIPLINFQNKGTARSWAVKRGKKWSLKADPIAVRVKKSGGFKPIQRAFRVDGIFGKDIFVRVGKARGPLRALRGPSMAGIVRDTARIETIKSVMCEKFAVEFKRGLDYAIGKGRIVGDE